MSESIFEKYVLEKIPREDDGQLFVELYRIYIKDGKDGLSKHLKSVVAQLEG
ncbi:hypothetical protein JW865_00845 [Candidatus Bathyarchaeota archaeon]|nr:hypothetical protein [Candidatus Bathyarchaeota archaeon]